MTADLTEGTLHAPQEVVIAGPNAVRAVDVIHLKPQFLDLLKVVVHHEHLGKNWMQVAFDDLCPVQLERQKRTYASCIVYKSILTWCG